MKRKEVAFFVGYNVLECDFLGNLQTKIDDYMECLNREGTEIIDIKVCFNSDNNVFVTIFYEEEIEE